MIHDSLNWSGNTHGMLSFTIVWEDTQPLQNLVIWKLGMGFTEVLMQIKWDDLGKALGTVPGTQ